MGKITRIDDMETHPEGHGVIHHQADIIEVKNDILMDVRSELAEKATFSMPIAQLATLGGWCIFADSGAAYRDADDDC